MAISETSPAKTIDVKGQICPYPLIETRNSLKGLAKGEVLEVLTDWEQTVVETVPNLCEKKGYPFEVKTEPGYWRIFIRKTD